MFVAETKKLNIMTTELTLHWEYREPDPDCGIKAGYVLIDITQGDKQIHLSPKLEELLNQEINPNN